MPLKLFNHFQTEDRLFAGVIQDVKANKSGIQLPVARFMGMLLQAEAEQMD